MSPETNETSQLIKADEQDAGKRLDLYLTEKIKDRSRSKLKTLIDNGDVLVNGKQEKSSYKLHVNDQIEIEFTEGGGETFEPQDISLDIVYEDEYLAVINKPAGMVVHPGAGVASGTLANAAAFHFGFGIADFGFEDEDGKHKTQITNRPGIVHRLDKDTSGLILVAKTAEVHEKLSEQFKNREVFKSYIALVHGEPDENAGSIEQPIAREKHNRTKMGVRAHGRHALSVWKVKKRYEKFALLAVEIKTGRTHQIRVHLAHINYPVVGDETYNAGRDKTVRDLEIRQAIADLNRFFLHAEKLAFTHPITEDKLNFTQPLPDELKEFLLLL